MRKEAGLLFVFGILLFGNLLVVSAQVSLINNTILAISSDTNAHGELFGVISNYNPIFYTDIYGWDPAGNPHEAGANTVLRLSADTNAHAQIPFDVCVGSDVKQCNEYGHSEGTECDAQIGCSFDEEGYDTCMTDCEWHTDNGDEASCEQNPECSWNANDETCSGGEARRCEDITIETDCDTQVGCDWISTSNLGGTYLDHEVEYGDLTCRAKHIDEGGCDRSGEQCVVKLSDWTNAHLEDCSENNYPIQICCIASVDCSQFEYKNNTSLDPEESCDFYDQCAWYPITNATGQVTTSNADGGGCCSIGEQWQPELNNGVGGCEPTFVGICNFPWPLYKEVGKDIKKQNNQWYYCAQVTPGVSTGYWTLVEKY